MYRRLTIPTADGYRADSLMAVERLGRLEDAIDRLLREYEATEQGLQRLSAQGKEETAVYGQLRTNRTALRELLLRLGCG